MALGVTTLSLARESLSASVRIGVLQSAGTSSLVSGTAPAPWSLVVVATSMHLPMLEDEVARMKARTQWRERYGEEGAITHT